MQKCFPAPFYCFDEIDAALDVNYIDNFVELFNELKEDSQYFITTFRENFLKMTNTETFEVKMDNGFSHMQQIPLEEAQKIVSAE